MLHCLQGDDATEVKLKEKDNTMQSIKFLELGEEIRAMGKYLVGEKEPEIHMECSKDGSVIWSLVEAETSNPAVPTNSGLTKRSLVDAESLGRGRNWVKRDIESCILSAYSKHGDPLGFFGKCE